MDSKKKTNVNVTIILEIEASEFRLKLKVKADENVEFLNFALISMLSTVITTE